MRYYLDNDELYVINVILKHKGRTFKIDVLSGIVLFRIDRSFLQRAFLNISSAKLNKCKGGIIIL